MSVQIQTQPKRQTLVRELSNDFSQLARQIEIIRQRLKLWDKVNRVQGETKKGNALEVLKALDKIKGVLPAGSPDGVTYTNQIRQEAEERWQGLQKDLG